MKKLMILAGALAALAVCADEVPEVSGITMTQGSDSRPPRLHLTSVGENAIM